MTEPGDRLRAAVAAGALPAEAEFAALLRSIVVVARSIFGARGSSIFLYDGDTDELVFAAVAAEEEQSLVGTRMSASKGIAGWVLQSGTPLVLEDVQNDPRFARDVAEGTGYVPHGLMAVPLLHDEVVLGVLQVLDRPERATFSLKEMELLGLFASQAAIALSLLGSARRARAALEGDEQASALAALASAVGSLEESRRNDASSLVAALARLLS
jgi:GAF domain-containing protein